MVGSRDLGNHSKSLNLTNMERDSTVYRYGRKYTLPTLVNLFFELVYGSNINMIESRDLSNHSKGSQEGFTKFHLYQFNLSIKIEK